MSENTDTITSLISGYQWDFTLNWLVTSGEKTSYDMVQSNSWGNYYGPTFTYTSETGIQTTKANNYSEIIPTGSTSYTMANNIYDLAGNAGEWSMEASGNYRYYYGAYNSDTVSNRGGAKAYASKANTRVPTSGGTYTTARAVLIIDK